MSRTRRQVTHLCAGAGQIAEPGDAATPGVRVCPVCKVWTIPFRNGRVRPHNDLRAEQKSEKSG